MVGLGIGAAATILWSAGAVSNGKPSSRVDQLHAIRDRYVLTETFTAAARALFSRASVAAAVLASAVNGGGLIDRQRNEVMLPAQEWEIATALREYSRLAHKAPKDAAGGKSSLYSTPGARLST